MLGRFPSSLCRWENYPLALGSEFIDELDSLVAKGPRCEGTYGRSLTFDRDGGMVERLLGYLVVNETKIVDVVTVCLGCLCRFAS